MAAPTDSPQTGKVPWLSTRRALIFSALTVAAFHLAYQYEAWGGLIFVYLIGMFGLAWVKSTRWAFYLGMAVGLAIGMPQLHFFYGIFNVAAVTLWPVFALWFGFYLLLARMVVERWPKYGALWIPVLWLALEYFRSELYYLRFAWLTPGFALAHPTWLPYTRVGVYGVSFFTLLFLAWMWTLRGRRRARFVAMFAVAAVLVAMKLIPPTDAARGPLIVGIQFEGASTHDQLKALDEALAAHPDADLFMLSEYSFDGPVPASVRAWCRQHGKHLLAGGREDVDEHLAGGSQYRNTAFVVSPEGEVVFRQAKSVPIQFFQDGLPAETQEVWKSPWGKIGIAICYDLSYTRVMDPLVRGGARALLIPTMDAQSWGEHEHVLHTKVAPVRAREYGLAILRVASSGISQLVDREGRVLATAPFPGPSVRIVGELPIARSGRLPIDRYLALPAVIAVAGLLLYLLARRVIELRQ